MFTSSTLLEWHLLYKSCTQEHTLRTHFSTAACTDSPSTPPLSKPWITHSPLSLLFPFFLHSSLHFLLLSILLYMCHLSIISICLVWIYFIIIDTAFSSTFSCSFTFSLFVALWPDMSVAQQRAPLYQSAPATNTECITGVILYPPTLEGGGMQMSPASAGMTKEQITEHAQQFLEAYRWVWLQLLCLCVTMPCVNVQSCSTSVNKDGCDMSK